jgi:hypothetical protein
MSQTTETTTDNVQQPPVQGDVAPPEGGGTLLDADGSFDAGGADNAPPARQVKPAPTKPAAPPPIAEGLLPLPENATDSQRADFEKKLRALNGAPGSPEEYGDFGYGRDIDQASDDYRHYTALFHEVGLSKAQAKKLLDRHIEYSRTQVEHLKRQQDAQIKEYQGKVKQDFVKSLGGKEEFIEFAATAARGFSSAAKGAGISDADIKGIKNIIGDDPRFLKIFHNIGKLFREDVLITGSAPGAKEKGEDEIFAEMFNRIGGK